MGGNARRRDPGGGTTLPEGPTQALLVFVAFLVAVGSLMLQGFTLPWLVRWLKLEGWGIGTTAGNRAASTGDAHRRGIQPHRGRTERQRVAVRGELVNVVGTRMTQPPDDDVTACRA